MSFSTITQLDTNILVDRQHRLNTSKSTSINKVESNNKLYLFFNAESSNNTRKTSYINYEFNNILLASDINNEHPVQHNVVTSGNSQIITNLHNVYISTYQNDTLYNNAWSMSLEIFVTYKNKTVVLSSTLLNLQNFKVARTDLVHANKYYSTYCSIECIDIISMMNSTNAETLKFVASLLDESVNTLDVNLLSALQYKLSYVDKTSIVTSPTNLLYFDLVSVYTVPENSNSSSLQGDVNVLCKTTDDGALQIGFDRTNTNLINTLLQIASSTELLSVEHTVVATSYVSSSNTNDFLYNGLNWSKLQTYDIVLSNPTEPDKEVFVKPIVHDDAELLLIDITTSISSSANSIAVTKHSQHIFIDEQLSKLKRVVYNIESPTINITNSINTTKNIVSINSNSKQSIIAQEQQILFAPITSINVANLSNLDDLVSNDFSLTELQLRKIPLTYAIRFVSDTEFDLRNYRRIFAIYSNARITPSKVDKDTLYFMLSYKEYDELAIEINGNIVAALNVVKA